MSCHPLGQALANISITAGPNAANHCLVGFCNPQHNGAWWWGALTGAAFFALIMMVMLIMSLILTSGRPKERREGEKTVEVVESFEPIKTLEHSNANSDSEC